MIERMFVGNELKDVQENAKAFIEEYTEKGFNLFKVNISREKDERVFVVHMSDPK